MSILSKIVEDYGSSLPLGGKSILVCTHITEATFNLINALRKLGAKILIFEIEFSRSKRHLDELQADKEIKILRSEQDLREGLKETDIIIEDGARVSKRIYSDIGSYSLKSELYTIEQTTNGIRFFQNQNEGQLWYPVINVSESILKLTIENLLATPESVISSFLASSKKSLTNKNVLLLGYGKIGRGLAKLCGIHGSNVRVIEIDPLARVIAKSRGFQSFDPDKIDILLPETDVVISCTDNNKGGLMNIERMLLMKNNSIVVNAGSGSGEIDPSILSEGIYLKHQAEIEVKAVGDDLQLNMKKMGREKRVTILSGGHPINLRQGGGTPTEIIELIFSLMILVAIKSDGKRLPKEVIPIDSRTEREVAIYLESLSTKKSDFKPHFLSSDQLFKDERAYGGVIKFGNPGENLERFSLARAIFEKGSQTIGHYHLFSEEAYIIEKGSIDMTLWHYNSPEDKKTYRLNKGDFISIPRGYVHHITALEEECETLVIASPPFSFWDQFFIDKKDD